MIGVMYTQTVISICLISKDASHNGRPGQQAGIRSPSKLATVRTLARERERCELIDVSEGKKKKGKTYVL
jgi:hypothetical protein